MRWLEKAAQLVSGFDFKKLGKTQREKKLKKKQGLFVHICEIIFEIFVRYCEKEIINHKSFDEPLPEQRHLETFLI